MSAFENIKDKIWLINKYGIHYFNKRFVYSIKKKLRINPTELKISKTEKERLTKLFSGCNQAAFFISGRDTISAPKVADQNLLFSAESIFMGIYPYFQSMQFKTDVENKWHYNPLSGFIYSKTTHWSKLNDISIGQGDIKFVWELSRFCYLYDIIRYDHHYSKDSSLFVVEEIKDWIKSNSAEQGPNYISGQEIALRILNWIYALNYYSESLALDPKSKQNILNSIHQQAKHIDKELYFSRTFVRNNHLLTESLALFTVGLLFPQFKESKTWVHKGYSIFCEEILFQFDTDGAYLQHSFNYQRVAMQLCTWFLQLCKINKIYVEDKINERLINSVKFMMTFIGNKSSGEMPNFGNNDGSLFFPLNNESHTNYYPQLQALAALLNVSISEHSYEDQYWFNIKNYQKIWFENIDGIFNYDQEGYYVAREEKSLTFFWCPQFKNRPAQCDILHLDLWYEGENIIRDNGTYLYNTAESDRNFFFGSRSHNTILFDGRDLMKKGERFIFYRWPLKINGNVKFEQDSYIFTGEIKIFPETRSNVFITRIVIKKKDIVEWEITDTINNSSNRFWTQIWNISDSFLKNFDMIVIDENNVNIKPVIVTVSTSPDYGVKVNSTQLQYSTDSNLLKTKIIKK